MQFDWSQSPSQFPSHVPFPKQLPVFGHVVALSAWPLYERTAPILTIAIMKMTAMPIKNFLFIVIAL